MWPVFRDLLAVCLRIGFYPLALGILAGLGLTWTTRRDARMFACHRFSKTGPKLSFPVSTVSSRPARAWMGASIRVLSMNWKASPGAPGSGCPTMSTSSPT